jgi:hypothetical protein
MMTSSKLKINVIIHVENSLSYNISKFGRKSITGKRDNLNWTKAVMTSSMKITFFEFRCKYDDFISLFRGQGGMEWYLQLMLFPTMIKKFWRAISISKMACFWSNLHYIAHSSTRGFSTLTRSHGIMKGQEWLKINGNRQLSYQESKSCKNFEFLPFIRTARAHNARADTYGRKIWKCSKWPGSCSKLFIGDFEHVKILTRAHVRVVTRTGTRIVSMLPYDLKFMCIEFG